MSQTDHERALRYVACEGSATRSKRVAAYPEGVGGYAGGGVGAHLVTTDGRDLIDWVGSLGATPLGYREPHVQARLEAIVKIDGSGVFSFPHDYEGYVAERICTEAVPWAEQVKFTKTGSEATSAAVRIARAATGREQIILMKGHYHGWHDWAVQPSPLDGSGSPGVSRQFNSIENYLIDEASSPDDLLTWLQRGWSDGLDFSRDDVAAIILEPATRRWVPDAAWLQSLVEIAHQHGTLVIFDEMLLGGRIALAGGSQYFNVQPDLACYGKAWANGVPFACVVGKREFMEHAAYVSGTYSGDVLGLAACAAVLDRHRDDDPVPRLWDIGKAARSWWGDVPTTGLDPLFAVDLPPEAIGAIVQACASQGVLYHPTYVAACAAMTANDLIVSERVTRQAVDDWQAGRLEGATWGAGMR